MKPKIKPFEEHTLRYEQWFNRNMCAYESELLALRHMMPGNGTGIEVGVGSGRFAVPLAVPIGIDPSRMMLKRAERRGITVCCGIGENLPFCSSRFDYVLMVTTLCFLNDVHAAFREVYRVLKPGGSFINGFVDRESTIGKLYEAHKNNSLFYSVAQFYSVNEIAACLMDTGFSDYEFAQTIFRSLSDIKKVEPVKPGYGEGSFVAIKAKKPR